MTKRLFPVATGPGNLSTEPPPSLPLTLPSIFQIKLLSQENVRDFPPLLPWEMSMSLL